MLKWESSAFPKDHAVTKVLCFQLKQVTRHVIMSTRIRSALFRHYLHLNKHGINEHVQPLHVCRSWSCKHIGSAWTGLFEQVFGYPLSATRIRVKQRSRDKSCWVRFVQHEFDTSRCIFNDHADVIMAICKAHCQRLPEPKGGRSMAMLCDFLVPANGLVQVVQPSSFEGHLHQTSPRNLREHLWHKRRTWKSPLCTKERKNYIWHCSKCSNLRRFFLILSDSRLHLSNHLQSASASSASLL